MNTTTQTSRNIQHDIVTLEGEKHDVVYELTDIHDIVMQTLDETHQHDADGHGDLIDGDTCAQCNMPTGTQLQRSDILCDYCADGS